MQPARVMPMVGMEEPDETALQTQLEDLLSGLSADELNELIDLAEAMHADGGQ
jgi:hypothetical protein